VPRLTPPLLTLLVLGLLSLALAQDNTGVIQVKAPPGIHIFLDGDFKGVTSADLGGLILQDLSPGRHELRAVKKGFAAQNTQVALRPGQVYGWKVATFKPAIKVTQRGSKRESAVKALVGRIVIQSVPIECTVKAAALGLDLEKREDELDLERVPVGVHEFQFTGLGRTLTRKVEVKANATVKVMVNFLKRSVTATVDEYADAFERAKKVKGLSYLDRKAFTCGKNSFEIARFKHAKTGLVFHLLRGGSYMYGHSPEMVRHAREHGANGHAHVSLPKAVRVKVPPFLICATEFSRKAYKRVFGKEQGSWTKVPPANWPLMVEWVEASRICHETGLRLPSQHEWEYACRGGAVGAYCFGEDEKQLGRFSVFGVRRHPEAVGTKLPNAFGLRDVHGNAREWCKKESGKHPDYRVMAPCRGGSHDHPARGCRSADYEWLRTTVHRGGFRPAISLP
jgi:formylglycine-generating enzyme required for sulfatase activity